MDGEKIVVQIVDVCIFTGDKAKKNIKGRIVLSDGVSKITCMLPEKTFNTMVSMREACFSLVALSLLSHPLFGFSHF